jgi:hypothetical protein
MRMRHAPVDMPFGLWRSSAWGRADGSPATKARDRLCNKIAWRDCGRADLDRLQSKVAHSLACSPRMRTDGDAPWGSDSDMVPQVSEKVRNRLGNGTPKGSPL